MAVAECIGDFASTDLTHRGAGHGHKLFVITQIIVLGKFAEARRKCFTSCMNDLLPPCLLPQFCMERDRSSTEVHCLHSAALGTGLQLAPWIEFGAKQQRSP